MCTPCVYHEEPLSLDIISNPNSNLDCSRLYHMTSRSRALLPLQTNKILSYLCPANPSQSLSTLSFYNIYYQQLKQLSVSLKSCFLLIFFSYSHIIISPSNVKLGKIISLFNLINQFLNQGLETFVLYYNFVWSLVILDQP